MAPPTGVNAAAKGRDSSRAEERTCFQAASPYRPEIDIQADVAIVYGHGRSLAERAEQWRRRDYVIHFMTGVAWGGYQDYFSGKWDGGDHWAEVQTRRDGSRMRHGGSRDVFYNVPTPGYTEYLKSAVKQAIDAGATAIHLEEPEFWVAAGYSDAFKAASQAEYGEPWQPPHSSVEARYRSGRLKQKLYTDCLAELFRYAKAYSRERSRAVRCFVPTHSLINYAHWGIVSPEGNLMAIPEADGYIAQVWTGTARTPNIYSGRPCERTFETAFLEYGQMVNMVRPTGRRCYLLADPVEDNPSRHWGDYRRNWEATVVGSLFQPEGHHFEVMPWPNRVFRGRYRANGSKEAERIRIPPDYATEVLIVTQALRNMKQSRVRWDCGTQGVGVLVSDSIMFQRGRPAPGDQHLSSFFGLALPLLKHGVPVETISLENVTWRRALRPYQVLLLTYENQKPLRHEYHDSLVKWMRRGGCLLYFDGGEDPFDRVREWWNDQGRTTATAVQALLRAAGLGDELREGFHRVGRGWLGYFHHSPRQLAETEAGGDFVRGMVHRVLEQQGRADAWKTQNYLSLQRGPYLITAVLDESTTDVPLRLTGQFVDLFDPDLPVVGEKVLKPGDRSLLYDLKRRRGRRPQLIAAAARAYDEHADRHGWSAVFRGPADTSAVARLWLPHPPVRVELTTSADEEPGQSDSQWDEASQTLWLRFANSPGGVRVTVTLK
ncbi:hypothetical protein AMJ85_00365 [candidate division BRC1 bacterium SM23_51]|nr:MAG: hypothetical protein AMJ85_00365 [candidate division BRC1 bacterium SM23_51]